MLEKYKNAQERWGGVSEIIDRWLKERQELLVLYCNLSDISSDPDKIERGGELKALCQVMVDYVSAGHFEIYDKLMQFFSWCHYLFRLCRLIKSLMIFFSFILGCT